MREHPAALALYFDHQKRENQIASHALSISRLPNDRVPLATGSRGKVASGASPARRIVNIIAGWMRFA